MTVRVRVPAKVNLHLRVLGRRPDGYHDLETVFHTLGLFDELRLAPADRLTLAVTGLPAPRTAENLVLKAAALLQAATRTRRGAAVRLHKRIPAGAGLGGGSADAAAALVGLNRLWRLGLSRGRLASLAARLGSDVPFLLAGGAAVGTGRGERLRVVPSRLKAWAVVAKPVVSVSTKDAYAALDQARAHERGCPAATLEGVERAVRRGDLHALRAHNDFEPVVTKRHPVIRRLIERLLAAGAHPAFMTGSGSAVVGVFAGRSAAAGGARALRRGPPRVFAAAVPLASFRPAFF